MVALDLELNEPSRRIVQIGAVLGNVRTGEVVSQFDLKVNPGGAILTEDRGADRDQLSGDRIGPSLAEAGQALRGKVAR